MGKMKNTEIRYKNIFLKLVKVILFSLLNASCYIAFDTSIYAATTTSTVIPPSASLYEPTASMAAYSGLGAAAPGDYSSTDANPAITSAFRRQYLIFGDTSWQTHDNLVDFGILDNTSTAVATLVRVRESVPNDFDTRDRRFTLGLAYQIPKTNLGFGVTMDYEQLTLTSLTSSNNYNYFGGVGFLYEYITASGRPIFVGAGMNRIFDAYTPAIYDTGISTTFLDGFYALSTDALSSNLSGLLKVVGSLDIIANQFLDLKGSYGYLTKDKKEVWGAGIFFHAPVIQLFYTFASSDSNDTTTPRQTAGCALNFIFN